MFGVIVPLIVTPAESGSENQTSFDPPALEVKMYPVVAIGQ
jgi:hypothetical protein